MGNKYSGEFREEALRLCEQQGVAAASEKLGVSAKTLYGWQRSARLKKGKPIKGLKPDEIVAKLQDGEVVMDEGQQGNVLDALHRPDLSENLQTLLAHADAFFALLSGNATAFTPGALDMKGAAPITMADNRAPSVVLQNEILWQTPTTRAWQSLNSGAIASSIARSKPCTRSRFRMRGWAENCGQELLRREGTSSAGTLSLSAVRTYVGCNFN